MRPERMQRRPPRFSALLMVADAFHVEQRHVLHLPSLTFRFAARFRHQISPLFSSARAIIAIAFLSPSSCH
jgi:hypothetical protein